MKHIAIVRNSFRIVDNPLYDRSSPLDAIVLYVDSERVPSDSAYGAETLDQTSSTAYGPHQYAFLLQVIDRHLNDLQTHSSAPAIRYLSGSATDLAETVASFGDECQCWIDEMIEPPSISKDSELRDAFLLKLPKAQCRFVNTRSLVEWHDVEQSILESLFRNVKKRCEIILTEENAKRIQERGEAGGEQSGAKKKRTRPRRLTAKKKKTPPKTTPPKPLPEAKQRLRTELDRVEQLMASNGLHMARFDEVWGIDSGSLEEIVSFALESTREAMSSTDTWQKKATAAGERLTERAIEPRYRCSHLSPFLAIGALSPCRVYVFWHPPSEGPPAVGTPADQLLFREVYHATSRLPGFWATTIDDGAPSYEAVEVPWKKEDKKKKDEPYWQHTDHVPELLRQWTTASVSADYAGVNESMVLLRQTGWIHHLRRHVVADYLTRSQSKVNWEYGERWFRHCLLDHDASVNRGNWLWLSATAYSFRNSFRHYGPLYIQNNHKPCADVREILARKISKAKGGRGRKYSSQGDSLKPGESGKKITDGMADPLRTTTESYRSPPKEPPAAAQLLPERPFPIKREDGSYKFVDHPEFSPNMSPKEVLQAGSFGGTYFRPIYSSVTHQQYHDVHLTLPHDWFEGLDVDRHLCSTEYRKEINTYGVKSGSSLDTWQSSGWINAIDPYGWFQWYCMFWQGRRTTDDDRQITRFNQSAGPSGRFRKQLIRECRSAGLTYDDVKVSPVKRQLLQHWGYRLTKHDFDAAS